MPMLTGKKILVIDDDKRICRLIELILKREGVVVTSVTDGQAGVERVRADSPHLVVLNVGMPGMDGREVCRRIRTFSQVPVLFLSGYGDKQMVQQALAWGDDYLLKPFPIQTLLARIQSLLHR